MPPILLLLSILSFMPQPLTPPRKSIVHLSPLLWLLLSSTPHVAGLPTQTGLSSSSIYSTQSFPPSLSSTSSPLATTYTFSSSPSPSMSMSPLATTYTFSSSPSPSVSMSASITIQPTLSPLPSALSCQLGYYCLPDRIEGYIKTKCSAGRYGSTTQLTDSSCSGPCPAGYWCPVGTWDFTFFPCPPGTMCPEGSILPIECPTGYACEGYKNVNATKIPCSTGYVCPSKVCSQALLNLPCAYNGLDTFAVNNSWCPPPVTSCTTFNCISSLSQCPTSGVLGATSTKQEACPGGRYQPYPLQINNISCLPCPLGTYSNVEGWNYFPCSGQCVAGKYGKKLGATIESDACGDCPLGFFSSVSASSTCQPCPMGSFANGTGLSTCLSWCVGLSDAI